MEFSRPESWVAFPLSRRSSQLKDWTQVSHIAGGFFTSWATRELNWATTELSSVAKPCPNLCDPHGNYSKNTGMGSHFLLQGIFQTHGSNSSLLNWQADSLQLSHQGRPQLSFLPIWSVVYREWFDDDELPSPVWVPLCWVSSDPEQGCWTSSVPLLCGSLWVGPLSSLVSALSLNFFPGSCSLPVTVQVADFSHITA